MRQKWSFNVGAMIQKAECKSSDASSSWQTMLRGCLTVHAFLFFEPLPSAPVQHKHTHTACSAHMLEVDVMSLLWPFSLMDVFMITFSSYPTPSHTFPLCCDFWIYLQAIFAWGLFNKPLIKRARTHADAHTQTHTQQCFLMADQTLADRVLPKHTRSVTHAYKHIHTLHFETGGC